MCAQQNNELCDMCKKHAAIYVEKKRRRGKLTRDQLCAGCLQAWYRKHGFGPDHLTRR